MEFSKTKSLDTPPTNAGILPYAFSPEIENEVGLKIASMLAVTAKGAHEGWEPAQEWTGFQLLDAYRSQYGAVTVDVFFANLTRLRHLSVFDKCLRMVSGEIGERFYPPASRVMAEVMCNLVGRCAAQTVSEAYSRKPDMAVV